MMFSEKIVWFGLRCCLYCGSLDRGPDGLCRVCSEDLHSWQEPSGRLFHQEIHKLQVESLFHWLPGRQEVLSKLVHALKGAANKKLWQYYAEEFLRRRWGEQPSRKPCLLIPAPSRSGQRDHAYCFVEGLIEAGAGFDLYNCLSRELHSEDQKRRTRLQREMAAMGWAENFTQRDFRRKSSGRLVIFVDDIVTTGSTARAAWRALGKPRDFAVWTLAQRGLSCGASKDLI